RGRRASHRPGRHAGSAHRAAGPAPTAAGSDDPRREVSLEPQPPLAPPKPPKPPDPAGTIVMLLALMLPSASRVPVTVTVSLSCKSDACPMPEFRTIPLGPTVILTWALQRASGSVRLC